MKHILLSWMACALLCMPSFAKNTIDLWPDGTIIGEWFKQTTPIDIQTLGKAYRVTDYGVINDRKLHTTEMQALIDQVAAAGGDLFMPGGKSDLRNIMKALENGTLTRRQLAMNATRVYHMAKALTEADK